MTASVLVHREAVAAIPTLAPRAWRDHVAAALGGGARAVALYGRPVADAAAATAPDDVVVTAVLQDAAGALATARTVVAAAHGYHTLTRDFPQLHVLERELHEQHGVRIADHPWLKPVRHAGRAAIPMAAYPYYDVTGKEVHAVAVGPIHAGVIEPGSFRFHCVGERVVHLEIQLGYQHRGVEARLLARDPRRLAPLVETIAGDTSVAHAWAYAAALEALLGHAPDDGVEQVRACLLELERVGMHLAGLSGIAADVGFVPGASTYGRLRTAAINASMAITGSRFGRGAIRPGGVVARLDERGAAALRATIDRLRRDQAEIDACLRSSRTVRHRLAGVGAVPTALARQLGLVGFAARASGVALDDRAARRGAYAARPIDAHVEPAGDCLARTSLRIAELDASTRWLAAVEAPPSLAPPPPVAGPLAASQLVVTLVEGWRGEVVHCVETDADGGLLHYKVQDPSLRNWMGLALAVREADISDFPICNKSFDLSYCGSDL